MEQIIEYDPIIVSFCKIGIYRYTSIHTPGSQKDPWTKHAQVRTEESGIDMRQRRYDIERLRRRARDDHQKRYERRGWDDSEAADIRIGCDSAEDGQERGGTGEGGPSLSSRNALHIEFLYQINHQVSHPSIPCQCHQRRWPWNDAGECISS